jgi:hypothetical protein
MKHKRGFIDTLVLNVIKLGVFMGVVLLAFSAFVSADIKFSYDKKNTGIISTLTDFADNAMSIVKYVK